MEASGGRTTNLQSSVVRVCVDAMLPCRLAARPACAATVAARAQARKEEATPSPAAATAQKSA